MKTILATSQIMRNSILRMLLLIVISSCLGYVISTQAIPLAKIQKATEVWNASTMNDCLLLEYEGKIPGNALGYNTEWNNNLMELSSIQGVEAVYTSVRLNLSTDVKNHYLVAQGYALSEKWLQKCSIKLSEGSIETFDPHTGYVPAIFSYSLK